MTKSEILFHADISSIERHLKELKELEHQRRRDRIAESLPTLSVSYQEASDLLNITEQEIKDNWFLYKSDAELLYRYRRADHIIETIKQYDNRNKK